MGRKEQLEWIQDLPQIEASPRIPASQRVYDTLLSAITRGTIRPGEHLVEQSLANALGVSRVPIREAVHRLAKTGLLEILPGQGAFVISLHARDIEEIFSFRALLEGEAARLATQKSLPSDLMRLEEIVREMAPLEKKGDLLAAASVDTRFHRTLVESARHRRLLASWETMESLIMMLAYNASATYPDIGGLAERHQTILRPMQDGDARAAVNALRRHVLDAGEKLAKSLTEA